MTIWKESMSADFFYIFIKLQLFKKQTDLSKFVKQLL